MEHEAKAQTSFSHADEALAAYLGDALLDKEVLVIGSKDLARELANRNARVTRIVRRDPQRRTRRDDSISVRVWPQGQSVDADCLVIPDIGIFAAEMEERLREACTWADTVVLGVGRDREISYEQFYALLVKLGLKPRMYGQAAFRGFALVDFRSAEEAEVSFDASLVGADDLAAERYLAVAGAPLTLDRYAIVQAPNLGSPDSVSIAESTPSSPPHERDMEARTAESVQREVAARLATLSEEQKRERASLEAEWAAEVQALESALALRAQELLEAREEAERRAKLLRDLTEQMKSVSASTPTPAAQPVQPKSEGLVPEDAKEQIVIALAEIAALKRELDQSHASLVNLEARRLEATLHCEKLEAEAAQLRAREASNAPKQAYADFDAQIAQLEEQLIARDKEILSLSSREHSLREQFRDEKIELEARTAALAAENTRLSSKSDSAEQRLQAALLSGHDLQIELNQLHGEAAGLRFALADARAALSTRVQATTVTGGIAAAKSTELGPQSISARDAMLARALNEVAQANSRRLEALALREESQLHGVRIAELHARVAELDSALAAANAEHGRALTEKTIECDSLREECARLLRSASQQERDARQRDRMRAALLTLSAEAQALLAVGGDGWTHSPSAELRARISELESENASLMKRSAPVQAVTARLEDSLGENESLRRVTMTLGMELEALRRAVLFGDADDASKRIDSLQSMLRAEDQATKLP